MTTADYGNTDVNLAVDNSDIREKAGLSKLPNVKLQMFRNFYIFPIVLFTINRKLNNIQSTTPLDLRGLEPRVFQDAVPSPVA